MLSLSLWPKPHLVPTVLLSYPSYTESHPSLGFVDYDIYLPYTWLWHFCPAVAP
jgi:hypothetical protein